MGHLDCLKYAHENDCALREASSLASPCPDYVIKKHNLHKN
jgi:hypothetical protein